MENKIRSSGLASDPTGLNALRRLSGKNAAQAAPEAAKAFEALMVQNIIKSARASEQSDGLFSTENTKMMNQMLDQQYAQIIAKRGVGLASSIEKSIAQQAKVTKE